MSIEKNIQMSQFNGTDYDNLNPKTKAGLVIPSTEVLSKFSTLNNADEILSMLGNYNLFWWRRRSYKRTDTVALDNYNMHFITNEMNDAAKSIPIYYSDAIRKSNQGIELEFPKTVYVSYNTYTNANVLKGKYFGNKPMGSSYNTIYYIRSNASDCTTTVDGTSSERYYRTIMYTETVKANGTSFKIEYGSWEFLNSINRNAYPDDIIVDGYEYEFLNTPFNNSKVVAHIATGSYVGTGTYGYNNPVVLNFNFIPRLVYIADQRMQIGYQGAALYIDTLGYFKLKTDYGEGMPFFEGKQFKLYGGYDSSGQCNAASENYNYIAIG